MKKFLGIMVIAASLVACNNSADTTDNAKDSLDSIASEKKDMIDSSAEVKKDVVDSVTAEKKDAVEKLDSLNRKDSTRK